MTVGQLRDLLAGLHPDLAVVVETSDLDGDWVSLPVTDLDVEENAPDSEGEFDPSTAVVRLYHAGWSDDDTDDGELDANLRCDGAL